MLAAAAGLAAGSFVNVVAGRLPAMLARRWRDNALASLCIEPPAAAPFDLARPRSRCPVCLTPIRPWHNVPLLGWLLLRGRCAACSAPISPRYPLVEAAAAALVLAALATWGYQWLTLFNAALLLALLAMALIDADTHLLPDEITLPTLWLGLVAAVSFDGRPAIEDSVAGAMAGYLVLWGVYHAFRAVTGREGMGHGDFKLLAALGAWVGWQSLPALVLIASLTGLAWALATRLARGRPRQPPNASLAIPFGPFLAVGGCVTLFFHDQIVGATLGLGASQY